MHWTVWGQLGLPGVPLLLECWCPKIPVKPRDMLAPESVPAVFIIRPPNCAGIDVESGMLVSSWGTLWAGEQVSLPSSPGWWHAPQPQWGGASTLILFNSCHLLSHAGLGSDQKLWTGHLMSQTKSSERAPWPFRCSRFALITQQRVLWVCSCH